MDKKTLTTTLLVIAIYLVTTGISYSFFSSKGVSSKALNVSTIPSKLSDGTQVVFDQAQPKTESCPLNGVMYSKEQSDWWAKHRPLGVMIENHEDARPQSGLSHADVIYEAVAEGGITRFLSVFYCQDAGFVGPVRSARTYFLDYISEYGNYPLYAHVGGANTPGPADALSQINDYGWGGYNDLNQFAIGFPTFWRDYDRLGHTTATEHTMYSTTIKLWDYATKERKLTNADKDNKPWDDKFVKYSFKEEAADKSAAQSLHIEFWPDYTAYSVDWTYDKTDNTYKRVNGGKPHIDKDTGKQLATKNIVVLFMKQSSANDGYENNLHLLFKTKGTGKALVLMDGKQIQGTWRKDSRTSRTLLFDSQGNGIKFNKGLIWFEIVPLDGIATVK